MTVQNAQILIVDDQENWRDALSRVLQQEGYFVDTAVSLDAARNLLAQAKYQVLVTDVRLVDEQPGDVGGLELLDSMKGAWQDHGRPGIVVLTGYLSEGIEQIALGKFKADRFFPKNPPQGFDLGGFLSQVKQLVAK